MRQGRRHVRGRRGARRRSRRSSAVSTSSRPTTTTTATSTSYVLRGGWLLDDGRDPQVAPAERRHGTFTDVTHAAGLAVAGVADAGRGLVRLRQRRRPRPLRRQRVARRDCRAVDRDPKADYPCNLFRNEGNGTFTDVAKPAGVTNDRYAKGVAGGDYDNDGWTGPLRLEHRAPTASTATTATGRSRTSPRSSA